jgi:hypothetical protein
MASYQIARPLPYLSTHASYLLELVQALYKEQSIEAVHLFVSQRAGEQADYALLHFYHERQPYNKFENPNHTQSGDAVLQVHSATKRIENKWFIEELEKRVGIGYPYSGIQCRENYDHVRYNTFSGGFEYDELVVVLEAMAQMTFTEKVNAPVRHHATPEQLRQELLILFNLDETDVEEEEYEDCELHLSADLNEDESPFEAEDEYDLPNTELVYHNFNLIVDGSHIQIDEENYERLKSSAKFNGEYRGNEFYNIMLSEVLGCLA